MIDALVVGGGPAGLSAALLLGRGRRSVVLVDGGKGRNRFVDASHSFFTRDGASPDELRSIGREQLTVYPSVTVMDGEVTAISGELGQFEAITSLGETIQSKTVILATGVEDVLPAVPGINEFWGKGVFQCPFCDGWEHQDSPMALYVGEEMAIDAARFYRNWSHNMTVLTNGEWVPSGELAERFSELAISVRSEPIASLNGEAGLLSNIAFQSGETIPVEVLWTRPTPKVRNELAVSLGCELFEGFGSDQWVQVDANTQTTIPGVYATGDMSNWRPNVPQAVSTGTTAGAMVTHVLVGLEHIPNS